MELRHLQALVAINDHGTFSAAAEHLGTVQSNISAHVARLERELGAPLIDRTNGRLSEQGEVVVARARRILAELDALTADVAACSDEVRGTVRVGMIGTTARWLVPQIIERTASRHPELSLVVIEGTTNGLEPQLANGQLDLAVLNQPLLSGEFTSTPLFEEDLALVVPVSHPFASLASVTIDQLVGEPLILPLEGVKLRADIDAVAAAAGVTLNPRAEMDSLRLISSLTFEGAGLSILPSGAVPGYLQEQFCLVPVEGLRPRIVGVAQRRRGMPGAPVRAVLEVLAEIVTATDSVPVGVRPLLSASLTPTATGRQRAVSVSGLVAAVRAEKATGPVPDGQLPPAAE